MAVLACKVMHRGNVHLDLHLDVMYCTWNVHLEHGNLDQELDLSGMRYGSHDGKHLFLYAPDVNGAYLAGNRVYWAGNIYWISRLIHNLKLTLLNALLIS